MSLFLDSSGDINPDKKVTGALSMRLPKKVYVVKILGKPNTRVIRLRWGEFDWF
jgi:hypothetical protein